MQTHTKKRVEIVLELPALKRLLRFLDDRNIGGYTVMPALAGRGEHGGAWTREGLVTEAGRMVVVVMILDETRLAPVFEELFEIVNRQAGIISVSDCQVVRKDWF